LIFKRRTAHGSQVQKKEPSIKDEGFRKKGSDTNAVTALHRLKTRKPVSKKQAFQ
jgi:hypothetical protein